jgi:hypothetical protein
MNRIKAILTFTIISLVFPVIFLFSCKKNGAEGIIIFTEVSGKLQDINLAADEASGQKVQSRIAAVNRDHSDLQPHVLTEGFYSARSPEISCDATKMLFSAQQKKDDIWQIWEMDLNNLKSRQVTSLNEDCSGPAYLPNGRVIFTRKNVMFSCNADGSDIRQVTFNPYNYSSPALLQDGRVLAISGKKNNGNGNSVFMVLRPDGTKNELFYKSNEKRGPGTRGWETESGRVVFIEADSEKVDGGTVVSINYNRPLHSRINHSSGIEGSFCSVFPLKSGKFMVSYRKSDEDRYGLYEFDPENKALGEVVYGSKDFDVAEVVAAEIHSRPRKLPSEVDMGVKTGLFLCQDVTFHDMASLRSVNIQGLNKIRIVGKDSMLGEIDAENDGSFYLKVKADTPFQIQTIDQKGNITGTCGWIYLRPNERRGCIGCHENPELVPENKVPLAVRQAPVSIPVHINKVVEKKVSLE